MDRNTPVPARGDSRDDIIRTSHNTLNALKSTRTRAVENDYCENLERPISAPLTCEVMTSTNHIMPRRFTNGSRMESWAQQPSVLHNPTKPPPIARELKPGFARRVETPPSLLPREARLHETQPLMTSRTLPEVGTPHFETFKLSRYSLISSHNAQQRHIDPRSNFSKSVENTGLRDTGRGLLSVTPPVLVQPRSLKTDDKVKKELMVEIDRNSAAKWRCEKLDKPLTSSKSNQTHRRLSADSDHALMEGFDGRLKPGEHSYPCPRCGKCMCPRCKGEKRDSSRQPLLCRGRCLCNADSVIDAVTCFCCVRACFYHCSNPETDEVCTVKPCSCQKSNRCSRWISIVALTPILPCLLCYPLARGCVRMCHACNEYLRPGCRCKESNR